MNGARRVVIFCMLTAVLPTILIVIPLYLRHSVFTDVIYEVSETDVLEISGAISTVFCQDHTIKMNTSFNAYQVNQKPDISNTRKHIRLKKSMKLLDDTIEFWGFFLPKGSTVRLSVCSRYDGGNILLVRGEKKLKTCGIMDNAKDEENVVVKKNHVYSDGIMYSSGKDVPYNDAVMDVSKPALNKDVRNSRAASIDNPDENTAAEDDSPDGMKTFFLVRNIAKKILENSTESPKLLRTFEETLLGHRLRHSKSRISHKFNDYKDTLRRRRTLSHGLKEVKMVNTSLEESSASSFEIELFNCYGKDKIFNAELRPLKQCVNVSYLLSNNTERMISFRNFTEDGYYYYIFYSDNDLVENDFHAIFDIHKPTYQFANITKNCINETICKFPVSIFSPEIVIVELPTDDGIEYNEQNTYQLVSVCHPRMSVYIIFPLLVLILILGCSFL